MGFRFSASLRSASHLAALLLLAVLSSVGSAESEIDLAMDTDPVLRLSEEVRDSASGFSKASLKLWIEGLKQPDKELQRQILDSITRAHSGGAAGLQQATPHLVEMLQSSETHPLIRRVVLRTLIVLDARDHADLIWEASSGDDRYLAELVEPALARWRFSAAIPVWMTRVEQFDPADALRTRVAIRCLVEIEHQQATDALQTLALNRTVNAAVRLEAATAAGQLSTSGLQQSASELLENSPRLMDYLVAAELIRHHRDPAAIELMRGIVQSSPAVAAARAVEGLHDNDPAYVIELRQQLLGSSDPKLRILAARSIAAQPTPETLRDASALLADPIPAIRREVRQAMARLAAQPELRGTILAELERNLRGNDWRSLEQSLLLAGELDHEPVVDLCVELLDHPHPQVMVAAAWSLRKLELSSTLPAMLERAQKNSQRSGRRDPASELLQQEQLYQALGLQKFEPAAALMLKSVPKGAPEPRAVAIWSLGKLYEDQNPEEIATQLAGRLSDTNPLTPEEDDVREQSAVALGRMGARQAERTLRRFAEQEGAGTRIGQACFWSLNLMFDEPIPDPPVIVIPDRGYPFEPLDK